MVLKFDGCWGIVLKSTDTADLRGNEDAMMRSSEISYHPSTQLRCPSRHLFLARGLPKFVFEEGDTVKPLGPKWVSDKVNSAAVRTMKIRKSRGWLEEVE